MYSCSTGSLLMSGARSRSSSSSRSACPGSLWPKILSVNIAPKTPPTTPPKRALQKKLLKEVILFVALIVPRKILELCWDSFNKRRLLVLMNRLLLEDVDERSGIGWRGCFSPSCIEPLANGILDAGSGTGIEDRGSGIGKKK